jgi:membrane-bound lytic murein transglycosylase D
VKISFYYTIFRVLLSALVFQFLAQPLLAVDPVATNNRGQFSKSSVSDILDSLVNATYFKDEHFSISKESEKFGFPSAFVPQYSDSVYTARIATLNRKTPLHFVYNAQVRGFIRLYAVEKRSMTAKILGLSKIYFPLFEEKLDANNVPLEMKYLAIVESALNPTAVSPAGAKGLWQFMYGTGKMYGLQSSSFIDERYDPYKSSVSASKYLRDLYNIYGDWFLALAAYNSGPGNVNKAIRRAGGVKDYWAIWDYLPAETRGYVPAFIAVNYIMSYYGEHNIRPVEPGFLYQDIDTLRTSRLLSFEQISETIGVPMADLQFLNPQYKLGIIPATGNFGNVIRLPKKFIPQFQKREQEIYAYKSAKTIEREALFARLETLHAGSGRRNKESGAEGKTQKFHIVEQGESLGSIARMYRTYISQLIAWNSLKDSDVTPGQKLIVFGGSDKSISSQANVSKRRSKNMRGSRRLKKEVILQRKYIAQSQAQSQLLPQPQPQSPQPQAKEIVAERLAKTVERDELFAFVESHKDLNAVTSVPAAKPIQNAVTSVPAAKPIQNAVTSVPAAKPIQNAVTSVTAAKPIQNAVTSIPPADPDSEGQVYITHVVVEGENLSSIAAKYGTTVSQLIAWNTLKDSQVTPGQKLIVFVNDGNGVSSQAVSGKGDVSKPVQ